MGRSSDVGDPMPPREKWNEYAERVLLMLGNNKEERREKLLQTLESLDESLTIARNIHRKTSHMDVAREFYFLALELNSKNLKLRALPTTPHTGHSDNKKKAASKLSSLSTPSAKPATSSVSPQSSKSRPLRDERGRFIPKPKGEEETEKPENDKAAGEASSESESESEGEFLDAHNDLCQVCEFGGELICCATCNLVFHLECLRPKLMKLPPDDWSCPFCISSGSLGYKRGSVVRMKAMAGVRAMNSDIFKKSCRAMKAPGGDAGAATREEANEEEANAKLQADLADAEASEGEEESDEGGEHEEDEPNEGKPMKEDEENKGAEPNMEEEPKTEEEENKEEEPSETNNKVQSAGAGISAKALSKEASEMMDSQSDDAQGSERRRRRLRHQTILYDPQLCPASKWQSDEYIHFSQVNKPVETVKKAKIVRIHYEDEASCAFCQGTGTVPICCFCACRVCFRKKDKDVVYCIVCEGKYHKACLPPDVDLEGIEEEWTCATCIEQESAGFREPATSVSETSKRSSQKENKESVDSSRKPSPSEVDEESQESSLPRKGRHIEARDGDVVVEWQSDHSLAKRKRGRPKKQRTAGAQPIKRKRGRPPKEKREPLVFEEDVSSNSDNQVVLKKRRGRPPKQRTEVSTEGVEYMEEQSIDVFQPPKKKRGRPPKSKTGPAAEDVLEPLKSDKSTVVKRKRGRPPKLRTDEDTDVNKNVHLLPKKKRGRPPKQGNSVQALDGKNHAAKAMVSRSEPAYEGQHEENGNDIGAPKGSEGVAKSADVFGDETNSQHSYLTKSSTYSASAAKGQSPRRSSRPSKPNSLFYDMEDGDTFSQMSNESKSSAGASAGLKQAGQIPAPRRSGRPPKPNSLLYELDDGEQHLRSAKSAAEQERRAIVQGPDTDQKKSKNAGANAASSCVLNNVAEEDLQLLGPDSLDDGEAHAFAHDFFPEVGDGSTSFLQKSTSARSVASVLSVFGSSTGAGADLLLIDPPGMSQELDVVSYEAPVSSHAQTSVAVSAPASSAPLARLSPSSPIKIYVDMRLQQHSIVEDHVSSSAKQPRRKPGARECMQISRRFHTQVIPQKYMDTLLDYVNRGKIEHLVRMRERLDEHSRMLESQLSGLEALVREKGEYQPG